MQHNSGAKELSALHRNNSDENCLTVGVSALGRPREIWAPVTRLHSTVRTHTNMAESSLFLLLLLSSSSSSSSSSPPLPTSSFLLPPSAFSLPSSVFRLPPSSFLLLLPPAPLPPSFFFRFFFFFLGPKLGSVIKKKKT